MRKRIALLGEAYVYGNKLFEQDDSNTVSIKKINSAIYTGDWNTIGSYQEVYAITRQGGVWIISAKFTSGYIHTSIRFILKVKFIKREKKTCVKD